MKRVSNWKPIRIFQDEQEGDNENDGSTRSLSTIEGWRMRMRGWRRKCGERTENHLKGKTRLAYETINKKNGISLPS